MRFTDIQFDPSPNGYLDLTLDDSGDLTKLNSFDTAIQLSIFCERRASETEVPEADRRRGWIGNINQPVEYGSKLWLLYQARLTADTNNRARDYLEQALQWFVDFGYLRRFSVSTRRDFGSSAIIADITFERFNSEVEHRNFVLWDNTGA